MNNPKGAILRVWALTWWVAVTPLSAADGRATDANQDEPGVVMQRIYEGQEAVSDAVRALSRRMDDMFGETDAYPDEEYDSVLRLRFIQRIDEGGGGDTDVGAGGVLSLPGTENRLSLAFASDDYDDPLDRERGTERELDDPTRRSLALRLLNPPEPWGTDLSVGLRSGDPIDLLTRVRGWRDFQVGSVLIRPAQSVFWYDQRGLGTATDFRFQVPVADTHMLFRSDSRLTWFKRDEQFYYDQVFSLLQPLGHRRDLLWQFVVQGESEPNHRVMRYYAQVRWRSTVHRDWLVLELRPQLMRERENDFRTQIRLYLGFELLFGDPRNY